MQIKNTVRYVLVRVRMGIIKKQKVSVGEGGRNGTVFPVGGSVNDAGLVENSRGCF